MNAGARRSNATASSRVLIALCIVTVRNPRPLTFGVSYLVRLTSLLHIECTYDQPSNRRRNPAPQYVEALETRLHKAEALLRVVVPDLNLDDPQFDVHATEKLLAVTKKDKQAPENSRRPSAVPQPTSADSGAEGGDEPLLETMVDNSGCLDVDDQGHWDYHGHTSGITFIRRLRKQLGATEIQLPIRTRSMTEILDSPKSTDSPPDAALPPTHDLPPRAVAHRLCHNALDDGCSLMRFVHEPSFYAMLNRIYDTPLERFTNEENTYLPLLYIVMSVGCLFSGDEAGTLNLSGYESAIDQGYVAHGVCSSMASVYLFIQGSNSLKPAGICWTSRTAAT